jgi:hypothetical protein
MMVDMDEPTEMTAPELRGLIDKTAEAVGLLADQAGALFIVNAVLIRELHDSGRADIAAIGAKAAAMAANLRPGVLVNIDALIAVHMPVTPPDKPKLTLIEGGKPGE